MATTQLRPVDLEAHSNSSRLREQAPAISIWEPPIVQQARASASLVAIPSEQQILDLIAAPLRRDENFRSGHDRKEHEIAALLAQLTPVQSHALSKRLAINAASDPLVVAFGRLLVERRNRLVAYLERLRRSK